MSMVNDNYFQILTKAIFTDHDLTLVDIKKAVNVPILVGSGVNLNNVHKYKGVDGFIIGSYFKRHGKYVLITK